jgi:pSer/pThr/pTyr-binding forkhead associated (FHA) protein
MKRRHASIFKQGTGVLVEDMGSINGTFVNDKRLDPYLTEPLKDGDTLQLERLLIKVNLRGK